MYPRPIKRKTHFLKKQLFSTMKKEHNWMLKYEYTVAKSKNQRYIDIITPYKDIMFNNKIFSLYYKGIPPKIECCVYIMYGEFWESYFQKILSPFPWKNPFPLFTHSPLNIHEVQVHVLPCYSLKEWLCWSTV